MGHTLRTGAALGLGILAGKLHLLAYRLAGVANDLAPRRETPPPTEQITKRAATKKAVCLATHLLALTNKNDISGCLYLEENGAVVVWVPAGPAADEIRQLVADRAGQGPTFVPDPEGRPSA